MEVSNYLGSWFIKQFIGLTTYLEELDSIYCLVAKYHGHPSILPKTNQNAPENRLKPKSSFLHVFQPSTLKGRVVCLREGV